MLVDTDTVTAMSKNSQTLESKKQKVIKIKVLVPKKSRKGNFTSVEEIINHQESFRRPQSCTNRPVMGTAALLTKSKSLNHDVSEVVQKLVLTKYQSTLTYFSDRSFARRKTRKRKSTGNIFHSTSSSEQSCTIHMSTNQEISESTIESYDELQFLKEALGDEMDAYTSTLEMKEQENDYSVCTCDISDLISSPVGSLGSRNQKSLGSYQTYCSTPVSHRNSVERSEDSRRETIVQQLLVQEQIIQQISKVVNFCKNTKQFSSSEEYVEAEKVLLLAMYKKEILLKDLMASSEVDGSIYLPVSGYISIKRLCFPIKYSNPCDSLVKGRKGFSYKYLCVITCGKKILASDVVGQSRDDIVQFRGNFLLDNLDNDFEVKIFLYSLIVKNNLKHYSEESKYHISKETVSCPTPAKLFHTTKRHNKSIGHSVNLQTISSFSQWGNFVIRLSDLNKKSEYQMSNVPLRSTLQGIAKVDMECGVVVKDKISGFLNMGTETVSWNRLWCRLDGQYLKFWNYPSDESENPACTAINLGDCTNYPLSCASREICPRPRTLLLKTNTNTTYFLSYDTLKELETWKEYLNSVIVWCKK